MFRRILLFKFLPDVTDAGILAGRLILAISIFLKHGYEKLSDYSGMYAWLARSHHYVHFVGVGGSLLFATITDGILTLLLALGIATRWCAVLLIINLAGAWSAIGFPYFGHQTGTDGELIISYIGGLVLLFFVGGGKYSVDYLLERRGPEAAAVENGTRERLEVPAHRA